MPKKQIKSTVLNSELLSFKDSTLIKFHLVATILAAISW